MSVGEGLGVGGRDGPGVGEKVKEAFWQFVGDVNGTDACALDTPGVSALKSRRLYDVR